VQSSVAGAVHLAHRSGPDRGYDFVRSEPYPWSESHPDPHLLRCRARWAPARDRLRPLLDFGILKRLGRFEWLAQRQDAWITTEKR